MGDLNDDCFVKSKHKEIKKLFALKGFKQLFQNNLIEAHFNFN